MFLRDHFGCRWEMVWKMEKRGLWALEDSRRHLVGALNGPQGASPPDGVPFEYGKELSLSATLLQHVSLVMNVHFEQFHGSSEGTLPYLQRILHLEKNYNTSPIVTQSGGVGSVHRRVFRGDS